MNKNEAESLNNHPLMSGFRVEPWEGDVWKMYVRLKDGSELMVATGMEPPDALLHFAAGYAAAKAAISDGGASFACYRSGSRCAEYVAHIEEDLRMQRELRA